MTSRLTYRSLILASAGCMAFGIVCDARAATHKPRKTTDTTTGTPSGTNAAARHQKAGDGGITAVQGEEISVTAVGVRSANGLLNTTPGGGMMAVQTEAKSRSGVTKDYILKQSPTMTAAALIASMPGVSYARTDPFGLSSASMTVRGLDQTEIGYLVDGIPLLDNVYLQPDSRAGSPDTDNMASVQLIQGSPDISTPAYYAVGGQVEVKLRDPSHKAGGYIDTSYGTYKTKREFIRLETGEIGHTGIRAYGSYSYTFGNNWYGPGSYVRHHVDARAVKEWGQGNRIALNFFWGQYQAYNAAAVVTKESYEAGGTSALYRDPTYDPTNLTNAANYYGLNRTNLSTWSVSAPMHFKLARELTADITPYFVDWGAYHNYGEAIPQDSSYFGSEPVGHIASANAVDGSVVTEAIDPLYEHTLGLMTGVTWKHGHNTFRFGDWYSYLDMTEQEGFALVSAQGQPANSWGRTDILTQSGQQLGGWNIVFRQQVNALYFDDTYKFLNDRLAVMAGFKEVMMNRAVTNLIPGATTYRNGGNYAEPLPQVAISYQITPQDQIYINGTTSFKAPGKSEAYIDIYDPHAPNLIVQGHPQNEKPEYGIGEEIGYRHHGLINVSAALFNYNLTNHQVGSAAYVGGTYVSATINVGGETLRGAQVEFSLRPWHHFSPYLSGSFVHATIDNNFPLGNGNVLPTAGKTAVNTPAFTGAAGLAYDDGRFFGNFNLNYVSSRYATFMNDEKVPGYIWASITAGYRLRDVWRLKSPQIQLNFQNVGNNIYYADAGGVTTNAHTARALNGTMIAGSAPQYDMGGGFALIGSLSTGF